MRKKVNVNTQRKEHGNGFVGDEGHESPRFPNGDEKKAKTDD
jgi:hypothetical protein